nr:MAG TPA: hypothetical protein [Caudoviricetes sp.]
MGIIVHDLPFTSSTSDLMSCLFYCIFLKWRKKMRTNWLPIQ